MLRTTLLGFTFCAALMLFGAANASALTFQFTGTVSADDGAPSGLIGEAWTATITFDPTVPNPAPGGNSASYAAAIQGASFSVAGNTWNFGGGFRELYVAIDGGLGFPEELWYIADLSGSDIGFGPNAQLQLVFTGDSFSCCYLPTNALPTTPPVPSAFFDATGLLINGAAVARSSIDTVTIVPDPVPEPGTALLMGLGISGLAAFGTRKRRDLAHVATSTRGVRSVALVLCGVALGLSASAERGQALEVIVASGSNLDNQTVTFAGGQAGLLIVDTWVQAATVHGPAGFELDVEVDPGVRFNGSTLFNANLEAASGVQIRQLRLENTSYYGSIVLGDNVDFDQALISNASISAGVGSDLSDGIFEFSELHGDFSGVRIRDSFFIGADLSGITGFDPLDWSGVEVDPTTTFGSNLALQALVTVNPGLSATTTPIPTPEPSTALMMVVGLAGFTRLGRPKVRS